MYHSTNNLLQFDIFSQFLLTAVKLYTYINFSFLALLGKKYIKVYQVGNVRQQQSFTV